MRVFEFLIEIDHGRYKSVSVRSIKSNHLQGAIRKLYQQEYIPFKLRKIL